MSVNHRDPITGVLTQLAGNGAPTDVGTAAFKDFTDVVRAGDHRLVEANAVANAIDQGLSSIYTPRGDIACAELTSSLLIEANIGNVYETSDAGTTSALFLQGADHPIAKGDNVGIIKAGQNAIMFNLMGNAFDLHDYQKKDLTTPITIGGVSKTNVELALSALNILLGTGSLNTTAQDMTGAVNELKGLFQFGSCVLNKDSQPILPALPNPSFFIAYNDDWSSLTLWMGGRGGYGQRASQIIKTGSCPIGINVTSDDRIQFTYPSGTGGGSVVYWICIKCVKE